MPSNRLALPAIVCLLVDSVLCRLHVVQLSGEWHLSNINRSVVLPTNVPGYALQTLRESGVIQDPLTSLNEQSESWVAEQVWTLERNFDLTAGLVASAHLEISLMGVDTAAQVYLNGKLMLKPKNAFREHLVGAKPYLHDGTNDIAIVIQPAAEAAQEQYAAYPYDVPTMALPHMTPHYNFLRKPPADFGWDWGPNFTPAGIYGEVQLLASSYAYLSGANVRQRHHKGLVELFFDVEVHWLEANAEATISITSEANTAWTAVHHVVGTNAGQQVVTVPMNITGPFELWWPVGYGRQTMYTWSIGIIPPTASNGLCNSNGTDCLMHAATVPQTEPRNPVQGHGRVSQQDCPHQQGQSLETGVSQSDCQSFQTMQHQEGNMPGKAQHTTWGSQHAEVIKRRVGLRKVELRREPLADGESFFFAVNDVPVYAKGANMITADIITSEATAERYRELVDSAVAAHMNMIRVWGGGVYPPQEFYDACDERGVLVWQEVMMACALYPRDEAFLSEIRQEVQFQMRRINWHPSVAIWGGNNEVETAMQGWFEPARENPSLYVADYAQLFLDTVQRAVAEVDAAFPFVDSSPSNGLLSQEPYVKRWGDAQSPLYGDVHFYNYEVDSLDPATYPQARFVSEFGFESLPSWPAYRTVTHPQDWHWNSTMSHFRMRHPNGTAELLAQAQRHFNISTAAHEGQPGNQPNPEAFRRWIYVTQLQQALTYQTAISLWRRLKGAAAHTMGVLYWQLNDVWLGASWSSMDFGGRWRLLHYSMKTTYAPFLVSAHHNRSEGSFHIWGTSDLTRPISGNLKTELIAWGANDGPLETHTRAFTLEALQSKELLFILQDQLLTYRHHQTKPRQQHAAAVKESLSQQTMSIKSAADPDHHTKPRQQHSEAVQGSLAQQTMISKQTKVQLPQPEHHKLKLEHHSPKSMQWRVGPADQAKEVHWPFLPGNDSRWSSAVSMCPPRKCFLRVSARLDPFGDPTGGHSCGTASKQRVQAAAASTCSSMPAHRDQIQHKAAGNQFRQLLNTLVSIIWTPWDSVLALGSSSSLGKGSDARIWPEQLHAEQRGPHLSACTSDSMSRLNADVLTACIDRVVSAVAAPLKQYMRELLALPSQHVIDSLAAEPQTSEAMVFFTEFKDADVPVGPNITMSGFKALSARVIEFVVSSHSVAAFVALETNISGIFSENGFLLLPWERREVAFLSVEAVQFNSLESSLSILSLHDTSLLM